MILAELKGERERINRKYCKGINTWTIAYLKRGTIREEDTIFEDI